MIGAEELDNIYDKGTSENDIKSIAEDLKRGNARSTYERAGTTNINPSDYSNIPGGPIETHDIQRERADNQSALRQFGNFIPRVLGKAGTGIIQGVGYLPELFDDANDYSNGLTTAMDETNDWLDKNFPIYRKSNKLFDFSDFGSYLETAEGLVSSIASFAVEGAGFAKLLGTVGKLGSIAGKGKTIGGLLTKSLSAGMELNTARKLTLGAEKVMTAGMMAYTEGAMSGKHVYDTVYQSQFEKLVAGGMDPTKAADEAHRIAGESAQTTVQLNTVINTGLNMMGGVSQFFRHDVDETVEVARRVLGMSGAEAKLGEKGLATYLERLAGETGSKYAKQLGKREGLLTVGKEAVAEGFEELTNQFAERTGIEEGKKGNTYSFLGQFGQLKNYINRVSDDEGAFNFILGAIAGPGQQSITQNIPLFKVEKQSRVDGENNLVDAEGKPVTNPEDAAKEYHSSKILGIIPINGRVSKKEMARIQGVDFFDAIKGRVQNDAEYYYNTTKKMEDAIKNGRPEEAQLLRDEMLNLSVRNSVALGMGDSLKNTFQSIANIDNTKVDTVELDEKIAATQTQIAASQDADEKTQLAQNLAVLQDARSKAQGHTAATRLGFATEVGDTTYKQKAEKAMKDLDAIQKIYEQNEFDYDTIGDKHIEGAEMPLKNWVFHKKAQKYLLEERKKLVDKELKEMNAFDSGIANNLDEEQNMLKRNHELTTSLAEVERKLGILEDIKADVDKQDEVLTEMGATVPVLPMRTQAMVRLIPFLKKRKASLEKDLDNHAETLAASTVYATWLENNPNKTISDYYKDVNERLPIAANYRRLANVASRLDDMIKGHDEHLKKLSTAKSLSSVMKITSNYYKELNAKMEKETLATQEALRGRVETLKTREALVRKQYERLQKQNERELKKVVATMRNNLADLENLRNRIDEATKNPALASLLEERKELYNKILQQFRQKEVQRARILASLESLPTQLSQYLKENQALIEATMVELQSTEEVDENQKNPLPEAEAEPVTEEEVPEEATMDPVPPSSESKEVEPKVDENNPTIKALRDTIEWFDSLDGANRTVNGKYFHWQWMKGHEFIKNFKEVYGLDLKPKHLLYFAWRGGNNRAFDVGNAPDRMYRAFERAYIELTGEEFPIDRNKNYTEEEKEKGVKEVEEKIKELERLEQESIEVNNFQEAETFEEPLQSEFQQVLNELRRNDATVQLADDLATYVEEATAKHMEDVVHDDITFAPFATSHGLTVREAAPYFNIAKAAIEEKGFRVVESASVLEELPIEEPTTETTEETTEEPTDTLDIDQEVHSVEFVPAEFIPSTNESGRQHGAKQVSPHNAVAHQNIVAYNTTVMDAPPGDVKEGDRVWNNTGKVSSETDLDVLRKEGLPPGTKLSISVDMDYDGLAVKPESTSDYTGDKLNLEREKSVEDYLRGLNSSDEAERQDAIDNIPIKVEVLDDAGNPTGYTTYIHKVGWILAEIPGSTSDDRFIHVVDLIPDGNGGTISGNAQAEADKLRKIREAVINAHLTGTTLNSVVETKGAGRVNLAHKYEPAARFISELELHVVSDTLTSLTGGDPSVVYREGMEGQVVALVPGANGTMIPMTVKPNTLLDNETFPAVKRLLEIVIAQSTEKNQKDIDLIENLIGKRIDKLQDLRNVFTQYFSYTTDITKFLTDPKYKGYAIDFSKDFTIEICKKTEEGSVVKKLSINKNGELDSDSVEMLKEFLGNRPQLVNIQKGSIQGLSSEEGNAFTELNVNNKGEWVTKPHPSYRNFIMSKISTNIRPLSVPSTNRSQPKAGEKFYASNPVIKFNTGFVNFAPNTTPITATEAIDDTFNPFADEFESLEPATPHIENGTAVTPEALTSLLYSTPQSERNGMTVDEALVALKAQGFKSISWNPFKKC